MAHDGQIIIKKVKKGHGGGHHGGAWKVAFADFVTAMMAFFMVMWIVGMSQNDRDLIQAYFNDPIGFTRNPPKNPVNLIPPGGPARSASGGEGLTGNSYIDQMREVEELGQEIKEGLDADTQTKGLINAGSVEVELTNDGLVIEFIESEMNGEVFFDLGSAHVRPGAVPVFAKVAKMLAETGRRVVIQGHTDARPMNRAGYDNFDLSQDRAKAVKHLMIASGLRLEQIISVDGKADRFPRVPSDPYHFSNRRVTVLLPYATAEAGVKGLPIDGFSEERDAHFLIPGSITPDPVDIKPDGENPGH